MKKIITSFLLLAGLVAGVSGCKDDSGTDDPQPSNIMTISGAMSKDNIVSSATPAVVVETSGSGNVSGTYNKITRELTYTITYTGLTGDALYGHFHIGAPGTNGPLTISFTKLTSPITGIIELTPTQADALLAGNLYANLHTKKYTADGEIRAAVVAK